MIQSLLEIPYSTEHDCRWVVCEWLKQCFADFDEDDMPSSESAQRVLAEGRKTRWLKVGEAVSSATRIGDVIYGERENGHPYVAAMVDLVGRSAVTSNRERKHSHLVAVSNLTGVKGVYRRHS